MVLQMEEKDRLWGFGVYVQAGRTVSEESVQLLECRYEQSDLLWQREGFKR